MCVQLEEPGDPTGGKKDNKKRGVDRMREKKEIHSSALPLKYVNVLFLIGAVCYRTEPSKRQGGLCENVERYLYSYKHIEI